MSNVKILIVEDELIIAEDIKGMLIDLHYSVTGIATDSTEAEELLRLNIPDLVLIDIQLRGGGDGISFAQDMKEKYHIPVVFITSHSDKSTVERAKHVQPQGYLVKPFEKEDLYTSIEIAIFNFEKDQVGEKGNNNQYASNKVIKDSIFIRKDYMLIKIRFDDLHWIKSDNNYLELYCSSNKHLVRSTLKEFVHKLPSSLFLQVHKSYCVNIKRITAIDYSSVWVDNRQIPVGRSHIENIKKVLDIDL